MYKEMLWYAAGGFFSNVNIRKLGFRKIQDALAYFQICELTYNSDDSRLFFTLEIIEFPRL